MSRSRLDKETSILILKSQVSVQEGIPSILSNMKEKSWMLSRINVFHNRSLRCWSIYTDGWQKSMIPSWSFEDEWFVA